MITVEWDLYSGQENMRWDLTPDESTDFISTLVADVQVVRPLLSIGDDAGGRGVIIHLTGEHESLLGLLGVPANFRITNLPFDSSYLGIDLTPSSPGDSEATVGAVEDPPETMRSESLAVCSLAYTSWNDFTFWNGDRRLKNNCYCYAANYATNDWSHPGSKGGSPLTLIPLTLPDPG